ncbi:MipA/OmpV family protein [Flocculibacter collagenilyticus]|uniref:MipA/OmpV family protein n=1 Tax=Flocculibacter collagenilyticus TaxID=2744479 RepID=UPI001F438697|nr:MipA/OmpV family protein [Flocculibacter collagenilyticus]
MFSFSTLMIFSQASAAEKNIRDGGYLDFGVGQGHESDPFIFDNEDDSGLDLYVNGRYQLYGVFVELPHGTSKQQSTVLSLGYNFLNTENWSYDIQLAMNHRDLEHKVPGTERVSTRESHSKLGLRILGDFDQTHLKFIVAGASGDPDVGLYASAWLSQNYQYYNWDVYGSIGIEYRNEGVVNYFYGVNENEFEGLPSYKGDAGFEYTGQVGASYPINEHWVFEAFARTTLLPTGITDSPLVDGNRVVKAAVVVKYVF